MAKRGKNPIEQATDAVGSAVNDVKLGAVAGAAGGALNTLGAKASGAISSNGDSSRGARKGQKKAGNALSQASDSIGSSAASAVQSVQKTDLPQKAGGLLQSLGDAAQGAQKAASDNGFNIDARDLPRLLRGATLLATGVGTLFAPGSVLDASRPQSGSTNEIVAETRKGIDSAADATQQRIKDLIDLARDGLSVLSDSLTSGIDSLNSSIDSAQKAVNDVLDDTEDNLKGATKGLAKQAKNALPQEKKSGPFRFLFFGLLIGGLIAFIQSPFSGPIGERVNGLRRDLGLGGSTDDSQYWPSAPQNNASPTTTTDAATSGATTTGAAASSATATGASSIGGMTTTNASSSDAAAPGNGVAPATDISSSPSDSADA